ncbi:unnamed protein product [Pleuronectes platessa]|uniref:Immunoglobulin C1-set domain-containing protein n=1 Tax=Pleuronectes platessa TaxID=8262 RepID=A0A9N7V0L0_PLEPL|nr:unnamed protein product [Pleuronectes platessa]
MKFVLCLAALAAVYCCVDSTYSPPKVDVYSTEKGKYGEGNTLICNNWQFHLMRSVSFTPDDGHKYSCKITHISNVKQYGWEPNM